MFKDNHEITKVEGNIFWLSSHNERNGIQQKQLARSVQQKRRPEIFGKTHRKTPLQDSFLGLGCSPATLLKKRPLHR